jgi:peptidoglycan hydrolase-like protein with peptidoglycan-binding domain
MEPERSRTVSTQSSVPPARLARQQQPGFERSSNAGNQAMQRMLRAGVIQPKLSVNSPGDAFEQQADRVADQVMRVPDITSTHSPPVQRKCAQCDDEATRFREADEEAILRMADGRGPASTTDEMQSGVRSALGHGRPLTPAARGFLEPRFGRDLGHVNVHTDTAAAASARALNAKAYTLGSDIAFARGEYQPDTCSGRRLLAHEITHTFQQGQGAAPGAQIQRTLDDGHDLVSPRFARNLRLEAAFDDERLIRRGATGIHVELLQDSLIAMGYTLPGFGADGVFGPETEAAIKAFQTDARAVLIDGIVGPETMGLFDLHDTMRAGGIGPPQRQGPVPGPLPAPRATCDTPYTGVTFALANQAASGVSSAALIRIENTGGNDALRMRGRAPANYTPDVTIAAPSDARAREFQVGFASNLLSERLEYFYASGTQLVSTLPTPIKDGKSLASGDYDPVFVRGPRRAVNENFAGNADTRHLVWPDRPSEIAFVNSADNPECAAGVSPGKLLTAAFIDSFRTWVVVRHRPSGCTRALHHIDWDLDWEAIVNTARAVPTVTIVSNVINVTVNNGNGQVPFIQGGQVPDDLLPNNRVCT